MSYYEESVPSHASGSRKPDYKLSVKERRGTRKGVVGAAWLNKNGSISIQLNPGTSLDYQTSLSCHIMLFPYDIEVEEDPPPDQK